jgi:DNA-binding MarR family transcriptional regulator
MCNYRLPLDSFTLGDAVQPTSNPPLPFDPIVEARRQWERRWEGAGPMATATAIIRAQQIVMATVEKALEPLGLTFARYEALVLLHFSRSGRLPLGKMGARLQVHPTSITNAIDRLEQSGLVRRVSEPADRRLTLAEITPAGRDLVEVATNVLIPTAFGLKSLGDNDLGQLDAILSRLRAGAGDFEIEP